MPAGSDSATSRLRFGSVEGSVRVLDNPKRDSWQLPALVIDSLSIEPGQRLADIGAGTGYFNVYFAKAVGSSGRVFAEEIEPELVAYMQERADREATPQVVPILGTRDDPCLPDSLDLIFLCNTYNYIDGRVGYFSARISCTAGGWPLWASSGLLPIRRLLECFQSASPRSWRRLVTCCSSVRLSAEAVLPHISCPRLGHQVLWHDMARGHDNRLQRVAPCTTAELERWTVVTH
jgi:SAM-dependent methyltransferase